MTRKIEINGIGETLPLIEDGSLVVLKESTYSVLGIFSKQPNLEIEHLFELNSQHLDLLQIEDNGVFSISLDGLKLLQQYTTSLKIVRKDDVMEMQPKEVCFLLDEGMLIIGNIKIINNVSNIINFPQLSFYRKAAYEFIEATFPDDIEAERQFLYEVPDFFMKKFRERLK